MQLPRRGFMVKVTFASPNPNPNPNLNPNTASPGLQGEGHIRTRASNHVWGEHGGMAPLHKPFLFPPIRFRVSG